MEGEQNFQQTQPVNNVSFPTINEEPKKSGGAKTLLIAGILILVGILGFVIFKSATKKADTITIDEPVDDSLTTPVQNKTSEPVQTTSPTPVSSSTPKAVSKSSVNIEIQNGTGITGEAAYLQNLLKDIGYTKISVGNASNQDATITTVTFSKSLSSDVVDELTKKLQSIYQEVSVKTSNASTVDALIVTGTRKGSSSQTAKPTATKSPTPVASPTATKSPSPTPTKTP